MISQGYLQGEKDTTNRGTKGNRNTRSTRSRHDLASLCIISFVFFENPRSYIANRTRKMDKGALDTNQKPRRHCQEQRGEFEEKSLESQKATNDEAS